MGILFESELVFSEGRITHPFLTNLAYGYIFVYQCTFTGVMSQRLFGEDEGAFKMAIISMFFVVFPFFLSSANNKEEEF